MGRLRQRITQIIAEVVSYLLDEGEDDDQKIEGLACSVLDYVRMRLPECPEEGLFVNVAEVAFRFRKTQWTIENALCLLESRGQATPTESEGLWKLQISLGNSPKVRGETENTSSK